MGEADYFIITMNSGFGRSAAMRAGKEKNTFTLEPGRGHPSCGPDNFTPVGAMSHHFSGL